MKHLVLTRIPPGDKWKDPKDKEVMETLTDAINHIFLRTGDKQFYIDCAKGEVYTDDGVEARLSFGTSNIFCNSLTSPKSAKLDITGFT